MLGAQLAGDSFHKCTTSKTILGTLNSQKFPAVYPTLHCNIPCVKVSITAGHRTTLFQDRVQHHAAQQHWKLRPEPPSLYDGTSPLHSKHRMPIRRPYTTNRPQLTQSNKRQSLTWSSPHFTVLHSMHTTQSRFQLVFQVRNAIPSRCTDSNHKTAVNRRHSQNCDEVTMVDGNKTPNTHKRTGSRCPHYRLVLSVRLIPSLPHRDNPVAPPNQPTRAVTIPRADNWLRNQLTCLGLAPRVHVVARSRCPSRHVEGAAVCARRCALPPAVGPLGRAPCSIALPSLAGYSSLHGVRGGVGCRARNESVEWRVVPTSTRRAADTTPHSHTAPKSRKAESQESRKEQ